MIEVTVDRSRCVGAGMCVLSSDEVFEQSDEDGLVRLLMTNPPERLSEKVRGAARKCPSLAIKVTEIADGKAP